MSLEMGMVAAWAQSVSNRRTADGSTIGQALASTQEKRPSRFQYSAVVGDENVGYNGGTGELDPIRIKYRIGPTRDEDDSLSILASI